MEIRRDCDFEEDCISEIPIIVTSAIMAKRCQKCDTIKFVNDKDWKYCMRCNLPVCGVS